MSTIHLAGTTTSYACSPGDTLLRAGLRAGLALPYECNVGSCGNCKVELIEGDVDVRWPEAPGLTEKDRARNRILGCQSLPRGDCTIKARLLDANRPIHLPRRFEAVLVAATTSPTTFVNSASGRRGAALPARPVRAVRLHATNGPRAYSMSNIDDGNGEWHFQIRRLPGRPGHVVSVRSHGAPGRGSRSTVRSAMHGCAATRRGTSFASRADPDFRR